jgi:hypothetical protein
MMEKPKAPVTVVETPLFLRQADGIWSEEERTEFVDFIATHPEDGDIVQDTGGVRKIRWKRQGTGKRGGVRVLYFYYNESAPLFLLMAYTKAEQKDVSPEGKRTLTKMAADIKAFYQSRS